MKKRVTAVLALLALTLPPLAAGSGEPAPDFTLASLSGRDVSLAQYRGRVVMLNFWASWCGPCRQEMPLLERIYQQYHPLGFTLLGVDVEADSGAARQWLQRTPVSFPILFDQDSRVSGLYAVPGLPSTVIIDRNGKVRLVHHGYQPGDERHYLDSVRALLREP